MRALCAAIVTAGSLIGLGLCAVGVGIRYQNLATGDPAAIAYVKWVQLDTPIMLAMVAMIATLIVGLSATFLGLAYHHERRHFERSRGSAEFSSRAG